VNILMEAQDDYFVNLFTPLYKTLPGGLDDHPNFYISAFILFISRHWRMDRLEGES
jgi:hypothetical protein